MRGYKFNHLAINSTTTVAGKAGLTLASVATAVVELVLPLYPTFQKNDFEISICIFSRPGDAPNKNGLYSHSANIDFFAFSERGHISALL